jgi:DNA-binding transcriptional regulator LsrR (DeoR family)
MMRLDHQTWELARVACLYYRRGMSQGDIAKQIGKSVMTVSRMLREATKRGIIEFRLTVPHPSDLDLERQLKRHFPHVSEFVVLDDQLLALGDFKESLGAAAAAYFSFLLGNNKTIGVGGGETVAGLVDSLGAEVKVHGVVVVQLSGMTVHTASLGSNEAFITQRLCTKLDAEGYFCLFPSNFNPADLAGKTVAIEDMLAQARARWGNIDLALVGIGHMRGVPGSSRAGYISPQELDILKARNAVGDVLLHFFDEYGQVVSQDIDRNVMCISWEQLKAVRKLVAVAGGTEKAEAILGALRSGLVDTLITDRTAAASVVNRAKKISSDS